MAKNLILVIIEQAIARLEVTADRNPADARELGSLRSLLAKLEAATDARPFDATLH